MILSTFSNYNVNLHLGSPRSINYLFNVYSDTLKVIEFYKMNFNVAMTECI